MTKSADDTSTIDPNDALRPRVTIAWINTNFSNKPLNKTIGNWKTWSSKILDNLAICGLGDHLMKIEEGSSIIPDVAIQLIAYANWKTNDGMARAYLQLSCVTIECELLDNISSAYDCFKALKKYHLNKGPVKQVNLIQNVLAQRVARDKDQVSNCRKICEDIRRAFGMPGGITAETFINITLLIILGAGHEHIQAMIQRDMQAVMEAAPFHSDRVLVYLKQDLQLLLGDAQCAGGASESSIALATQSNLKRGGTRSSLKCSNCHRPGHIADWCVRTGGGRDGGKDH